jgi:MFS superfamily sulfate permease-like transporter
MVAGTISSLENKYMPPVNFNYTQYKYNLANNLPNKIDASNFLSFDREQAKIMIMMANTFWIGFFQIVMFVFQLGFITSYLSEPMLNGFLIGCAVQVFTSQLKSLFGIGLTSFQGIGHIPKVLFF